MIELHIQDCGEVSTQGSLKIPIDITFRLNPFSAGAQPSGHTLNKLPPAVTCPPLGHTASHRSSSLCSVPWTHSPPGTSPILHLLQDDKVIFSVGPPVDLFLVSVGGGEKHRQAAEADLGSLRFLLTASGLECPKFLVLDFGYPLPEDSHFLQLRT